MRKQLTRSDAEAIRAEVDSKRGYPRTHSVGDGELVRVGIHVDVVRTETAVAIDGDGADVTVTVDDADEQRIKPARRARLRAAKEPVEDRRDPVERERAPAITIKVLDRP